MTDPTQTNDPDGNPQAPANPQEQYRLNMVNSVESAVASGAMELPEKFQNDPAKFVDSYLEMERQFTQQRQQGDQPYNPMNDTVRSAESGSSPSASPSSSPSGEGSAPTPPQNGGSPSQTTQPNEQTPPTQAGSSGESVGDSQNDWTDLNPQTDESQPNPNDVGSIWPVVQKELQETGKISEDTINQYKIPADMATYLTKSHEATTKADRAKAMEQVGGEQRFKEVMEFARTLPENERQAYQEQLRGPNWTMALDALSARHAREKGQPTNINVSSPQGSGAHPWGSEAERMAHFRDPRYRADPKFHQAVIARERATLEQKARR